MSLRVKLTLWLLVAFVVIEFVLVASFLVFSSNQRKSFRSSQLAGIALAEVERLAGSGLSPSAFVDEVIARHGPDFQELGFYVEWRDENAPPSIRTTGVSEPAPVLLGARANAPGGALIVGITSDPWKSTISEVYRVVLIASGLGLVGAAGAGWIVSGVALSPLNKFREELSRVPEDGFATFDRTNEYENPELAEVRAALSAALADLRAAMQSQERFLANVSHELNTPIAVMLTEIQAALATGDHHSPDASEALMRSNIQELKRLGRMIESFLMLTRLRDGRREVKGRVVAINDVVVESLTHCAGYAEQQGVTLYPHLHDARHDGEEATIFGDEDLLATMVDNLINNAIRFSMAGDAVYVTVLCESVEGGGQEVKIVVRDEGPGIPGHLLGRVFDRFTQAPDEMKRQRGSGLGLEIAQGIAELHGGRIRASNAEDGGAVMIVHVPLVGTNHAAKSASSESCFYSAQATSGGSPSTVPGHESGGPLASA